MFEIINLILIFSRMAEFPKYFLHFFFTTEHAGQRKEIFRANAIRSNGGYLKMQ